ncbi:PrsW family intramembrane metalloprotease [Saccharopolyspora sp. K220]|uniref:PrsW family intramembrane metalloprotease n=1 Tax=Saccharopolyspora soli TaxID=2926618 RepID=UPI001F58B365|nr:PrsW family intramembrane metalloprotease [Saccharopolyspora soli]MCI2423415.1 PrsW family intramembrane metalloprotease [Saccharopolyspora soli]
MSRHDLGEPAADISGARRFQTRKYKAVGWPVAGLIVLGFCGLVMAGVTTSKVGLMPALVGAAAALLPVAVVFIAIVWIDRWEPEPPMLLLGAFLWGVGGATACSLLLNDAMTELGNVLFGPTDHRFFVTAVMGPLVEEAAKALFVVALWFRRRSEFNGLVDGIVYAALTAAGFAFTENILYFGKAFAAGGLGGVGGGVVAVFILRGVLAPFSHPLFSSMFGIGIGLASRTDDKKLRLLYPLVGYFAAVVLHAVWNAATLLGGAEFLNVYFLIMVPIFFGTGWLVAWQRKREQRIVIRQLPVLERAGLIVRSEMEMLATLAGRRGWLRKVRRSAGHEAAKAVRDYQIAVTELAFLQHRADQGHTTSAARRARRERLIADLKHARRSAAGTQQAIQTARIKLDELTQRNLKRPSNSRRPPNPRGPVQRSRD